jgi:hypothetical protein
MTEVRHHCGCGNEACNIGPFYGANELAELSLEAKMRFTDHASRCLMCGSPRDFRFNGVLTQVCWDCYRRAAADMAGPALGAPVAYREPHSNHLGKCLYCRATVDLKKTQVCWDCVQRAEGALLGREVATRRREKVCEASGGHAWAGAIVGYTCERCGVGGDIVAEDSVVERAAVLTLRRLAEGRRDMNRRTAENHPDPAAREAARVRADAYEMNVWDCDAVLKTLAAADSSR